METRTWKTRIAAQIIGEDTSPAVADPATIGKQDPTPATTKAPTVVVDIDPDNLDPESDKIVTISQKRLGELFGKERKKYRTEAERLAAELDRLNQQVGTTQEEKDRVARVLEQTRMTFQTEVERREAESNKLAKDLEEARKKLETETKAWQRRHNSLLVDNAVTAACTELGVYKPTQMRDMLDKYLNVEQAVDDKGNPLEEFKVVVRTKGDDGGVVSLPVKEFIQKMDQSGEHPNLFNHNLKGGLGANGGSAGSGGAGGSKAPLDDAQALAEWLKVPANRKEFLKQNA